MLNATATNGGDTAGACIATLLDSEGGTVESQRFYLALRTVVEMVTDRGYKPEVEIPISLPMFRAVYGHLPEPNDLRFLAHRLSNPNRKILVIFCGNFEIRKANIVGILSQITNKESLDRVILILQGGINSHAQKLLADYPVKVETFKITDLLVNITKHAMHPTYEMLPFEEKQMFLKKYNIQDNQIPKMLENDAIARYYGLEKGQVVRVIYDGDITGTIVTYRCVV